MQVMLLSALGDWADELGVGLFLVIALIVVTLAIGVAAIITGILRFIIFWNYWIARKPSESRTTGEEAALAALQHMGITDVKVEMAGFFRALFYSNHYNPKRKTIYLRRSTFNGRNISSIALAVQKAALVLQERENSGKFYARWRMQQLAIFGPIIFIPIVVIGVIIDFILASSGQFTGIATLVASGVGFAFFVCSMVLAGLVVSVEKRGTRDAAALLAQMDVLTEAEQVKARKVLRVYIITYITDFIITILKLLQFLLKIAIQLISIFGKDSN